MTSPYEIVVRKNEDINGAIMVEDDSKNIINTKNGYYDVTHLRANSAHGGKIIIHPTYGIAEEILRIYLNGPQRYNFQLKIVYPTTIPENVVAILQSGQLVYNNDIVFYDTNVYFNTPTRQDERISYEDIFERTHHGFAGGFLSREKGSMTLNAGSDSFVGYHYAINGFNPEYNEYAILFKTSRGNFTLAYNTLN